MVCSLLLLRFERGIGTFIQHLLRVWSFPGHLTIVSLFAEYMQAVWVFAGGPAPAPPMDYTSVRKDDPKALCAITDKSGVLTAAPGSLWAA